MEWHIASITNRWTKRALVNAGFGYPSPAAPRFARWKPIFSVAEIGGASSAATAAEIRDNEKRQRDAARGLSVSSVPGQGDIRSKSTDTESVEELSKHISSSNAYAKPPKVAVVHGLNRPFFHIDLTSALQSAIRNTELKSNAGPNDESTVVEGTGAELPPQV